MLGYKFLECASGNVSLPVSLFLLRGICLPAVHRIPIHVHVVLLVFGRSLHTLMFTGILVAGDTGKFGGAECHKS